MTDQSLLAVNAGSSSVRLDLFSGLRRVKQSHLKGEDIDAAPALRAFAKGAPEVRVVAHRVVHGGPRLQAACLVSEEVEAEIRRAARLAPLHNPVALRWLDASRQVFGAGALQVAVSGQVERSDWRLESWSEKGSVAECVNDFAGWHPEVVEIIENTESLHKWGLFVRDPLPRWSLGRVTRQKSRRARPTCSARSTTLHSPSPKARQSTPSRNGIRRAPRRATTGSTTTTPRTFPSDVPVWRLAAYRDPDGADRDLKL